MGNYALQKGPCSFLNLPISPWEVSFPLLLCFSSPWCFLILCRRHPLSLVSTGSLPLSPLHGHRRRHARERVQLGRRWTGARQARRRASAGATGGCGSRAERRGLEGGSGSGGLAAAAQAGARQAVAARGSGGSWQAEAERAAQGTEVARLGRGRRRASGPQCSGRSGVHGRAAPERKRRLLLARGRCRSGARPQQARALGWCGAPELERTGGTGVGRPEQNAGGGHCWSRSRSMCRQRVHGGAAMRESAADGGAGVWTREQLAVQARSAGAGGAAAVAWRRASRRRVAAAGVARAKGARGSGVRGSDSARPKQTWDQQQEKEKLCRTPSGGCCDGV
jgi:hypothetical protein